MDTASIAQVLQEAGFEPRQATAIAQVLNLSQQAPPGSALTKADLEHLATKEDIANVKTDIANVKADIFQWLWGLGIVGALATLQRLLTPERLMR
jgi:hypothetical protein